MNNIKNKYNLNEEFGVGYASNTNSEFYFDMEDFEKIKKNIHGVKDLTDI